MDVRRERIDRCQRLEPRFELGERHHQLLGFDVEPPLGLGIIVGGQHDRDRGRHLYAHRDGRVRRLGVGHRSLRNQRQRDLRFERIGQRQFVGVGGGGAERMGFGLVLGHGVLAVVVGRDDVDADERHG